MVLRLERGQRQMVRKFFRNVASLAAVTVTSMVLSSSLALAAGDVAAGEKIFKKCKACHVADSDKNRVGPTLKGVFNRSPGALEGYKFSKALKTFGDGGALWDDATMDSWLTKPKALVKGTKMGFSGLKKEEDRANVIAYLRQFSE